MSRNRHLGQRDRYWIATYHVVYPSGAEQDLDVSIHCEGNRHPFDFPVPFSHWNTDGRRSKITPISAKRVNPSGFRSKRIYGELS